MKQKNELLSALFAHDMLAGRRGILVGYSGGADSSAMLSLLKPLCEERGIYLHAMHVHHGIRGKEADRDADFCEKTCRRLGVDFTLVRADVPSLAKQIGRGIEETARDIRYSAFLDKVQSDERLCCIATAHNADDNAETVIYNLARGSAINGICGIAPIRDKGGVSVIRPLLYAAKQDIVGYCEQNGIEYIFDSTNADTVYTRNYIRHEVMPRLDRLNPSLLSSVTRMTDSLRSDAEYLDACAKKFANDNVVGGTIKAAVLSDAPKSIATRVVRIMFAAVSDKTLENVHIDAVLGLARDCRGSKGSVSLPGRIRCVVDGGRLYFTDEFDDFLLEFEYALEEGVNRFDEGFAILVLKSGDTDLQKYNETLQNIYKLSIHTKISFDKINHALCVRSRRSGDSYVYGGMTRKLKKLYNDRAWSAKKRATTPVLCDEDGILWVPEFPAADRVKLTGKDTKALDVIYYHNGEEL